MIKDWNAHSMHMDFSNINVPSGQPSDIDMLYIVPDWVDEQLGGFLIVGEIKNELGTYDDEQRRLHKTLIDNNKVGGAILYITHNKTWQDGDKTVDVGTCKVNEYYYKGAWHQPKEYTIVNEAIPKLLAWEREARYGIC